MNRNLFATVIISILITASTQCFGWNLGYFREEAAAAKRTFPGYRIYEFPVSPSEKEDIRYILKSMAQKSLAALWSARGQLEEAGERIDHVHPLRFLECVFQDEELKTYIHNIKKRGSWIWSEFVKGFKASLQEEADLGNMRQEYIDDFLASISLEPSLVAEQIRAAKWEEFIKTLIANVPRNGDTGRYDQ